MPGFEASTWMVTWALAASVVASTAESKNCLFLFIIINCLFSGLFLFCCLLFAGSMKLQLLEVTSCCDSYIVAKVHKIYGKEVDKTENIV